MNIYTSLQIGSFHSNHCEDFLVVAPTGNQQTLIAVMDGCTMGTESVFASILIGKLLRKIAKEIYYEAFVNPRSLSLSEDLKKIVSTLMQELKLCKNQLDLEIEELLSTLIIAVIDTEHHRAECLAIGDGLIVVDGIAYEYEQNDKPDYLGYHLSEEFNIWYAKQTQRLTVDKFRDLAICTDGIFSFKNFKNPANQRSEGDFVNHLLTAAVEAGQEHPLDVKIRKLQELAYHSLTDDLAIIRIVT